MGYLMSNRIADGAEKPKEKPKGEARPVKDDGDSHHGHFFRMLAASHGGRPEDVDIKKDVGDTAGEVYQFLEKNGESRLRELRAALEGRGPLFMAALGWLLREDKIGMKVVQDGVLVRLK